MIIEGMQMSFNGYDEGYYPIDSSPVDGAYGAYESPSDLNTSSRGSHFSPQSYSSDPHLSSYYCNGSPLSGSSSGVCNNGDIQTQLREVASFLLGDSGSHYCSMNSRAHTVPYALIPSQIMQMGLEQVIYQCVQAISDSDYPTAETLMDALGKMVSVRGTPIERLGAYMLEGLRARLEYSGYTIYKNLRCDRPTGPELLSFMSVLYEACPYYKFAYMFSNAVVQQAMGNKRAIHIIDFQIAMGTQWIMLLKSLADRPGGPPLVRITGVDDPHSAYARGGGLEIVGQRLKDQARSSGVPFEFHAAAMSGSEVEQRHLMIVPGEPLAVNFPYMLHHMPDESVSTTNHRDRLLRLVRSLSPEAVTLVEQESNTNTPPFIRRAMETLDYYTAMFESVDVVLSRDNRGRISAEQHCLARDIVNMLACEDDQRVERHELFGKWKARFTMAGFSQLPVGSLPFDTIKDLMTKYDKTYRLEKREEVLFLGWKSRFLATASVWR